jgi:hypothetical protein
MLKTNAFNKSNKRSTFGSYLKYENAKKVTKIAMLTVRYIKLYDNKSIKNSNFISNRLFSLNHLNNVIFSTPFFIKKKFKLYVKIIQKYKLEIVHKKKTPYKPK